MSKKKLLQMSVIAAIATILLIPASTFVIGQEDTTPPSVAITEPANGAKLNITNNVNIAGTASDGNGKGKRKN